MDKHADLSGEELIVAWQTWRGETLIEERFYCDVPSNLDAEQGYRTTSTGTLPSARTSDAWLPRNSFLRPRRP